MSAFTHCHQSSDDQSITKPLKSDQGFRPALLIAVVGDLVCNWLFLLPKYQFSSVVPQHYAGLAAYLISCVAIIVLGEAMRRARFRAEASEAEIQREIQAKRDCSP